MKIIETVVPAAPPDPPSASIISTIVATAIIFILRNILSLCWIYILWFGVLKFKCTEMLTFNQGCGLLVLDCGFVSTSALNHQPFSLWFDRFKAMIPDSSYHNVLFNVCSIQATWSIENSLEKSLLKQSTFPSNGHRKQFYSIDFIELDQKSNVTVCHLSCHRWIDWSDNEIGCQP